jgi:hypothetical protein
MGGDRRPLLGSPRIMLLYLPHRIHLPEIPRTFSVRNPSRTAPAPGLTPASVFRKEDTRERAQEDE